MIKKYGDVTLEWHGDKIKEQSKSEIRGAMMAIGLLVQASATYRAPVDTGNLKNSIQSDPTDVEVTIGTNVDYARKVEYGIRQRAQPYLRPALDENTQRIRTLISNALSAAFRKGGGR